ncbi:putative Ig domain-containing protein [Paenibacillus sp. V4I5]|uniref:putative Ig domain-containing protein n=1 Tax=Paenibacillus sp. V4I5 TaxID=3042306 RepID=UPI0027942DC8|nr:putative Ig domain-containing protein [Paenibacillus sp. V4I5]MDQ0920509.1 hypothetical protein [Paenibacillus sp. V4I5]
MSKGLFKQLGSTTNHVKKVLSVGLIVTLFLQITAPIPALAEELNTTHSAASEAAVANENGYLDKLIFGDAASESAHQFKGDFTTAITGLIGESARVSNPRVPAEGQGGDLTFTIKVDPYLRNYFTMKFSGDEGSNGNSVVNINGEQVGYVRHGDYEAINKGWILPNRFYYNTIMLPLESTVGKETVEITIKTLNVWGKVETASRGYYNAYTHTQAYLNVDGETQGSKLKQDQTPDSILAPDKTDAEKLALINAYTQGQIDKFNNYSAKIDAGAGGKLSIIRYQDELKYYATVLKQEWSPANTPQLKKAAIERIFKTIDNHVKDYYGNTRLVLRGGHQGDWGGYYGALGEALYIVENLIKDDSIYGEAAFNAFLDQQLVTGTVAGEFSLAGVDWNGGDLTRREAWERALKANFDFARARLSYIYNQVVYTYEGAWEAHEGLRLIGSRFYEGKERSHEILLEALGAKPFLGEEVLVGPNDEELDLYHSLFYHDGQAVFTDDFVQIVGKGFAKSKLDSEGKVVRRLPYGKHYTGISEAGLTRENTYVANYGEASNYLKSYFYKTLDHAGDEEVNDEILKLALKTLHARGYVRYTDLDNNGKRIMRAEQVTDERNQGMPGFYAYGVRVASQMALQYAALEMTMAKNEQRYSGPEWDEYWLYAKEAVGYLQQQLADHQFFNNGFGNTGSMSAVDYLLEDAYQYVTADRAEYSRFGSVAAGVVLPQTDFDYYKPEEIAELGVNPDNYERFAWVDIDNMYISLRDGDFRMFGSLYERNRGAVSNGRIRVMNDNYDHNVQIATNNIFQYEDYNMRSANIDVDYMSDQAGNVSGAPQALAGEIAPMAYQPGVGTVNRDNYEADNPYSGYTDLMTTRYGKYFVLFNTTRDEYGNKKSFDVELPADYTGSEILDLVTGTSVPIVNGKVTIAPKSAMVLKLTSDIEVAPKPFHVDFANALVGNGYVGISWKTTSGGQSYTIKRSETENGDYVTIATGVTGNYFKDLTVQNGKVYYYKVAAVNKNGAGWDSWRAKVDLSVPVSGNADTAWRDDRLSTTAGSAAINSASIAIDGAGGTGLGIGDDYHIYKRYINDSLHFVSQVAAGSSSISAKIDSQSGEASGIMMRDQLAANSRYIYFGADQDGNLVLQNRTRISFHQSSNQVASPLNARINGYMVAEYPYIKLARDHDSQFVYAFVSKDGVEWNFVAKMFTVLTYAYYIGVAASDQAQFNEVTVTETSQGTISPFIVKVKDQVTVNWNKPKQASWFNLYSTKDEAASLTDPVFKPGTMELADGSPWTEVLTGTRETSFKEASLKYGSVHYKVIAVHGDGTAGPFSATASAYADSIAFVLADAENLPAKDYTKMSFYLFHKELDRIKAEMAKPGFDEEQLINEIHDAHQLLVSFRTLLTKVEVQPSMVRASEKGWNNDNISEAQNGWFIFDGILTNITHTRSAVSWVDIDFGAGNEKVVDTFRYLPREGSNTLLDRANRTVFKGSNDKVNWTDLHKISGVTQFKWYSGINTESTPYRYIRIYDDHNGFVNFTEVEFLERGIDKTLLAYLLDESTAAIDTNVYTAASLQSLEEAASAANLAADNANAKQDDIDTAAANLLTALKGLVYIPGIPVISAIGNKTVIAGNKLTFNVHATNAVTDVVYGVIGLPEGSTFHADTRTFEWTPSKEQGGEYSVTFTATAGELTSSRDVRITVKGQPIISPDATVELTAKQPFTYQVPATDPTGESLIYSAVNLPAGAVLGTSNGVLAWTPTQADYGSNPVTLTVNNGNFTVSQIVDFKVNLNIVSPVTYTKGSYYLYLKEVKRIEGAMKTTGANMEQLAAELDQAELLLVSASTLPAEKITLTSSMVVSSHRSWDKKYDAAQNGWRAFDGNTTTSPDTEFNPGWILVDLGTGNEKLIGSVKFIPRTNFQARMNGALIQGSNDGTNFVDLYTISGITQNQWYTMAIPNTTNYRYYRYYSSNGNANVAELEFYKKVIDRTLLDVLKAEVNVMDENQYSEEKWQALKTAIDNANALPNTANQGTIDAATADIISALEALNSIPVFTPIPAMTTESGTSVTFSVYAVDKDGDALTYSSNHLPLGASFVSQQFAWTPQIPGSYGITFAVYDARGATANMTVDIQVVDTIAPTTTDDAQQGWANHDVMVNLAASDSGSGVAATYYTLNGGIEQMGTTVNVTKEGTHSLVYWSVDNAGNVEGAHTVTIQIDKTAPELNVVLDKTELWPPNHSLVTVTAQVYGNDSLSGIDSIVLTSITSNEPDQGTSAEDQPNDIQNAEYGTLDSSYILRAERSEQGTGRTYTITYTATDKVGNVTVKMITVTVPHDHQARSNMYLEKK